MASQTMGAVRLLSVKPHELAALKKQVAIEMARQTLEGADFSRGDELLTESQRDAYDFIEMLYYDGEITYGQLWSMCKLRHGR